jgi:CheY-like chemotaxis protein
MSKCSVLLVEDEPLLQMMWEDLADVLQIDITGLEDSVEGALKRAEDLQFSVAVLDVNLTDGHVGPVASRLNDLGIPYIVTSGNGPDLENDFPNVPILRKPFSVAQMVRAMEDLCASGAK